MKQFIFIDILTNEKFVIKCEPYKIHNIELWNEDFAEWCNVSQGDFEVIFSETINTDYNHNQIDRVISKITRFMKTLEDLFSILSRLDYIGKKRDGSIFVSENTDEREAVIHAKRSRTFLAD